MMRVEYQRQRRIEALLFKAYIEECQTVDPILKLSEDLFPFTSYPVRLSYAQSALRLLRMGWAPAEPTKRRTDYRREAQQDFAQIIEKVARTLQEPCLREQRYSKKNGDGMI